MSSTDPTGQVALRPLKAAGTTALLGQADQCPTSTHYTWQTNRRMLPLC